MNPPVPLPAEAEDLLTWLRVERGRSANTLEAYRRDLSAYSQWLTARSTPVSEVVEGDINAYIAHLRASGRAPSSQKRALVAVRSLHRFLAEEHEGRVDPAAEIEVPRVPAGLPKALTESEVDALLQAVSGTDALARRDRALLELLYGTGARISELVGASLSDLDLDAGLLRVYGKGSKERVVPLGRYSLVALVDWLSPAGRDELEPDRWARRSDSDALFLNRRGGRLSRQGAWMVVKRVGEQIGIGDRLSPHVLRHSCATHMVDHGADIRTVQELLGHASISTTQVYTKVSTERLWAVYRQAHPRARDI
ncbi:MAG: site-specific tyrosine recombinase XerD [Microthrixaceae bacterium]|nr:site-specific tyrosine recombinase XerD [Acidimicrobiales bacterium]MCB9404832.1 site-specific tyrosine recombinase XerD [Microthrixaceae bacterium]